jgi:hypothetical protein
MRRGLAFGVMLLLAFSLHIHAQKVKVPCYEGDQYQSCTPSEKLAKARLFARAKTVAVIVEAKRTVSCGDGSDDTCIVNDGGAIKIIQDEIGASPLWDTFAQAEPKRADILLKFNTRNRGTLQLCAYD